MPDQMRWQYEADATPVIEANRQLVASLLNVEEATIKNISVLQNLKQIEEGFIATQNKIVATLENGEQVQIKYTESKKQGNEVTRENITLLTKETQAIESNTAAQAQNAAQIQKRQAAEAMRRGELALQTIRAGVQVPGRASEQELFNLAQAEGRLKEFAQANVQISKDVVRIWNEVGRGAFNAYTGKLRELQRLLVNVKTAQEGLGASADKEAKQAAAAIDQEFKALDRLQQAQLRQAAAQDRIAAREQAALNKRLNASGRIIEAERKAAQVSQQTSTTAVKGLKSQEAQSQKTAKGVQQVTLSWQSMARIVAIQYLHRAISGLTQAMEEAFDKAADLSIRIAEIQTISQDAQLSTHEWRKGLLDLSASYGIDVLDQAEAAYQTLSNQVAKGADAFRFLEEANKFAITAVTSSTNSVNLLTAAINAYRLNAQDASSVAAILFKTIELGRVRADEMGQSFGDVAVLANQLGIGMDELGASIATLTIQGLKYNKAGTQLRGIFIKLIRPSKEMKDLLEELGYSSGEAAIKALGLGKLLAILQERTKGSSTELGKFFSRIRGISGALALTGEGLDLYNRNLTKIQDAQESYNNATQIALDASGRRIKIFKEQVNRFTTEIATFWVDLAAQVVNGLTGVEEKTSAWIKVIKTLVTYTPNIYSILNLFSKLAFGEGLFDAEGFEARFKKAQQRTSTLVNKVRNEINKLRREIDKLFKSANREFAQLDAKVISGLTAQEKAALKLAKSLVKATVEGNKASLKLIDELIKKEEQAIKKSEALIKSNEQAITAAVTRLEDFVDAFELEDIGIVEQFKVLQDRIERLQLEAVDFLNLGETERAFERLQKAQTIQIDLVKRAAELEKYRKDLMDEEFKLLGKTFLQRTPQEEQRLEEVQAQLKLINGLETDRGKLAERVALMVEEEVRLRNEIIEQQKKELANAKQREANLILLRAELTALATEFAKFDIQKVLDTRDINQINQAMLRQKDIVNRILDINKEIGADAATQQRLVDRFNKEKEAAETRIAKIKKENDIEELRRTEEIAKERISAILQLLEAEKTRIAILRQEQLPVVLRRVTELDQTQQIKDIQALITSAIKTGQVTKDQVESVKNFIAASTDPKIVGALAGLDRLLADLQSSRVPELTKAYGELRADLALFSNVSQTATKATKEGKEETDLYTKSIEAATKALVSWGDVVVRVTEESLKATQNLKKVTETLAAPPIPTAPPIFEEDEEPLARGGQIRGHGSDRIPALLNAGEFVVNKRATRRFFSQLLAINSGNIPRMGGGGMVTNVGDIQVSLQSSGNEPLDIVRIGKGLRREIRRGRIKLT